MALFEDTNPRELKELLGQIHSGESALPDFQRNFVWEPGATQELIVSIANNYPAGSLLRIRNTRDLFARREFQGAPPLDGRKVTFLVLDGQQRLTSLYQAFFGVGEHRFFLRLRDLMDGADFEEAIFHLRENAKRTKLLEDVKVQASELIAPLSVLKSGFGGYSRWVKGIIRNLDLDNGARVNLEDKISDVEEKWIQVIDDYRFPVVTLSDETEADAVCTIFETLNRTGIKLSPFELLTARFWPRNVNLRQLWKDALTRCPIIEDFDVDPYYVLQAISLVARTTPSCKRSDVLNLQPSSIEGHWNDAIDALNQCLQILTEDCGAIIPKWVPYYTILITFTAVLTKRPLPSGPDAAVARTKLTRWYWCSVFGQTYENASNSQSAKDVGELVAWLDGGEEPETISQFVFDPKILRDTTARQRALYKGCICLVLQNGARDFHSNQPISANLIVENHIDDHHIFPDSHLKKTRPEVEARLRDCVLNRTLIDRTTNQVITDRAPSDYVKEMRDAMGETDFGTLLASHFIPHDPSSPVWQNDFEVFLDRRQSSLWEEIKLVTGVEEASDLIEQEASA